MGGVEALLRRRRKERKRKARLRLLYPQEKPPQVANPSNPPKKLLEARKTKGGKVSPRLWQLASFNKRKSKSARRRKQPDKPKRRREESKNE